MNVVLVHNPGAGSGELDGDELVERLGSAGHHVTHLSTGEDHWREALRSTDADLVAVSGGDGTVQGVLVALVGTDATVGVVATGTANNIARTLGTPIGDPGAAVAAWSGGSPIGFDLPVARWHDREQRFVESFGGGLFADLLSEAADRERQQGSDGDLLDGLRMLRELLTEAEPRSWRIELDGRDLSGEYLAVEVMNIRTVGPAIELAPGADPGDGVLDLVLVADGDRSTLLAHVDEVIERAGPDQPVESPDLVVHRGATVRLGPPRGAGLHVDDEISPGAEAPLTSDREVVVTLDGASLQVLVP